LAEASTPGPEEQVRALYEQGEAQAAKASEELVGSRGFGGLLGQVAENAAAVTKLSSDAMDLVLRNLRVAGRRDVVRLARQLARTEDKLERVLQEVEQLRDELARPRAETSAKAVSPVKAKAARASRGSATGGSEQRKSP
jgi:molecular chaperone GrpE (heat shock protein)